MYSLAANFSVDIGFSRYGFDQVNYSGGQPSSIKPQEKKDPKNACDQCSYIATQKGSLTRHKQTQHEGIRQLTYHSGKTYDCDVCPLPSNTALQPEEAQACQALWGSVQL